MKTAESKSKLKTAAKIGIPTACVAAALSTAGVMAYFTDTDAAINKFSVAAPLTIDLTEPAWSALPDSDGNGVPDKAQAMVPLQTVAKDPKITNTCEDVDAYMFMQVKVPTASVSVVAADGSISPAAQRELFTYQVNSKWEEMGSATTSGGYTTHTYKYKETLAPGATTAALFENVTLINLVDESLSTAKTNQQISIDAYGIQSAGFATAEEAWNALGKQNVAAAHDEN